MGEQFEITKSKLWTKGLSNLKSSKREVEKNVLPNGRAVWNQQVQRSFKSKREVRMGTCLTQTGVFLDDEDYDWNVDEDDVRRVIKEE